MTNGSNPTHEDVIGELVDKACNYAVYGGPGMARLPAEIRIDAMTTGLLELRDGLRQFYVGITGTDPWKDDPTWQAKPHDD